MTHSAQTSPKQGQTDLVQRARQTLRNVLLWSWVNRVMRAVAHALPKAQWHHRLPVAVRTVTANLPGGEDIVMSNPARCQVAQELYWNGGVLGSAQDRHAFEIGGENDLLIHENVLLNDLADRVQPHLVAVGGADAEMRPPFAIGFSALASSVSLDWSFDNGIRVPVRRLDDLFPEIEGPVAMKIDVEGFEMEVFDGAHRFLERRRPDMGCEVLRRARRVDEMMDLLRSLGYRWLHIAERVFKPRNAIVADKHRLDWLLTTRSDAELARIGLTVVAA